MLDNFSKFIAVFSLRAIPQLKFNGVVGSVGRIVNRNCLINAVFYRSLRPPFDKSEIVIETPALGQMMHARMFLINA